MSDAGKPCTQDIQCQSGQCVLSYTDHNSYKCSNPNLSNTCTGGFMLVLFDDFSTDCKGALGTQCQPTQKDFCAYSCYPEVGASDSLCSQKFLDCSSQTGTVSAILTSSSPIQEICAKQNGEICNQQDICLSGQCYQTYEDHNIKKCSTLITCGSNTQVHISSTESACKYPNGSACTSNNDCLSKACYPSFDNNNNLKCSVTKTCSTGEIQVYIDNSTSQCKKVTGEICSSSQDCANQQCYSDFSHASDLKCAKFIQCTSNQIQYYIDNSNSDCKALNGQICSNESNCVSKACYLTLNDSSQMKCSVPVTCSQPNIGYHKDDSNSKCFIPGGEPCNLNDGTCAYGCFQYQMGAIYKCSAGSSPTCNEQNIGLMKTPDYLVKCYLIADQDCSQANDLCQFTCLMDIDQNKRKCSSNYITCSGQFQPFIQSKNPVCKLNNGIICNNDSDCLSNACYINFSYVILNQKLCAKKVTCTDRIPVYVNQNLSSKTNLIVQIKHVIQQKLVFISVQFQLLSTNYLLLSTCLSPNTQFYQDNQTSVCKLAAGLSCSSNADCGYNSCFVDFSAINQYFCAVQITCSKYETQVYIDSTNSACKQSIGETCSTLQNQDCVTKACYQTVADSSVSKCSVPITCTALQSQYFQDNTQSICKLAIGIDCTDNSECIHQACYLIISNTSKYKCAIPTTCVSPAQQYFKDSSTSVCKIADGFDCQNNSDCLSNSCFTNYTVVGPRNAFLNQEEE
ncbi:Conserved_hypothetical protein [Hexamita inflata]|uniref:Uncharacterized protein n=1 Tax=Hexamita inflata TaxID=28002 RepID=A0ABP1HPK8_9EUKA